MSLREKLHAAWKASGMTLGQLLVLSGLQMTEVSLGRKLGGKQTLRIEEGESIATALGVTASVGRGRRAS